MGKHPLLEQVDALRMEVDAMKALLATYAANSDDDRLDAPQARYPQCVCKNCSALLGVYNPETEELQMRIKDQFVYIKGAPGSHIRIICRRCLTEARLEGE